MQPYTMENKIDSMIAEIGIHDFLHTVANVCMTRSKAVMSNWQDKNLELAWLHVCAALGKAREYTRLVDIAQEALFDRLGIGNED